MYPPATRLIKCDVQTHVKVKWLDFVDGGNGCLYGIPWDARRVVEYNVEDKSIKEIGPDLGDQWEKYLNGIKADNGNIYCMPRLAEYPLKIIPGEGQNAEVKILQELQLPDGWDAGAWGALREMQLPEGDWGAGAWGAGALANDGCIYYFPSNYLYGGLILKLDPNDGDSLSLVVEGLYREFKTAVLGNDGFIYVISGNEIIKFSPTDYSFTFIGRSFEHDGHIWTGAVLAEDGNIYAANHCGQILRIDRSKNDWEIIGNKIYNIKYSTGWGNAVLGADKCIYFPPYDHDRVLKFNPSTQSISLVGESYGEKEWKGAVLASDGYIYCIPYDANDILQIDSRHVNEQVIGMIENLQRNDKNIVENATEVKKR